MPDDTPARFADESAGSSREKTARPADWRTEDAGVSGNNRALAVLSLLLLLTVAGVLIGIFAFWLGAKPPTRFVAVPIGEYHDPTWPVNPWAKQDVELIATRFPDHAQVQYDAQQLDKFRTLLGQLATTDSPDTARQPLVLYVSALSAMHDGKLCLLPADAQRGDPSSWMPVEELLDRFEKAAAEKGKLLILDLSQPTADPFAGLLRNESSEQLHALLEARSSTLTYPVLVSCGPGEVSLPCDSSRSSGFAFYLAQGIRGAADGYLGEKFVSARDEEVTTPELAEFLTRRVGRWARLVHDRNQTPRLYGPADGLAFRAGNAPAPPDADPHTPEPCPQWLVEGWKYRVTQKAVAEDLGLWRPFARLTAALLRAEQEWPRSGDTARAGRNWEAARERWQKAVADSGKTGPSVDRFAQAHQIVSRYRLATARRHRPPVPDDWAPALDRYLAAKQAEGTNKNDETVKFKEEWLKKATPEKGPDNRLDAAWLLWDRVRLVQPDASRARAWVAALDDLKADREFSETLLLRAVEGWEPRRQGLAAYPHDQVAELLRAEAELSNTVALGPDGFALVLDTLERARRTYVDGQKNLFQGKFADVTRAHGQLKEAADGFKAAGDALMRWQAANRTLDAAATTLLDTMPIVLAGPQSEFDAWVAGVRAATALADELAPVGRDPSLNLARLAETTGEVIRSVPATRDPFAIPPEKKEPDPLPPRVKPADVAPYQRLLMGTTLPAESRRRAWDMVRADQQTFQEVARAQDEADDAAGEPSVNPSTASESGRVGEQALVIRRARASVELLRLCGSTSATRLSGLLNHLEPDSGTGVQQLGEQLRRVWVEELPQQARTAAGARRWHEARRIARMTPPGAAAVQPPSEVIDFSPAGRSVASKYRGWVRDQLLADQTVRPDAPGATAFYESVRQDLELGPD